MQRRIKAPAAVAGALAGGMALFVTGFAVGDAGADNSLGRPDEHTIAITWIVKQDGGRTGWPLDLNEPTLAPRKGGGWYHAYLQGPEGRVSAGTFNAAGEPGLTLWSGVSPVNYPRFVVVSEPDGQVVASAVLDVEKDEHHSVAPVEMQP